MVESVLMVLGSALKIWEHKERNKYAKKLYDLEKKYYKESNKSKVDHAVLDGLEFDIQLLARSFSSEIGKQKAQDMPG